MTPGRLLEIKAAVRNCQTLDFSVSHSYFVDLLEYIAQLEAQNAQLEARNERLQTELSKNKGANWRFDGFEDLDDPDQTTNTAWFEEITTNPDGSVNYAEKYISVDLTKFLPKQQPTVLPPEVSEAFWSDR